MGCPKGYTYSRYGGCKKNKDNTGSGPKWKYPSNERAKAAAGSKPKKSKPKKKTYSYKDNYIGSYYKGGKRYYRYKDGSGGTIGYSRKQHKK